MKKLFSILCVTLLLCSAITVTVSAAAGSTPDDPKIFTSSTLNSVKIPAGATYYVSYTDTTGAAKREIRLNSTNDKTAGFTVTYGEVIAKSDADGYCNIVATPDANGTYLMSIQNHSVRQITVFIDYNEVAPYVISDAVLYDGENTVTTEEADYTLFAYEPAEIGVYEVAVDNADAVLSLWAGTTSFVAGVTAEVTGGKLEFVCEAIGQTTLIGLSGVDASNIIITRVGDYILPDSVEYVDYVNKITPNGDSFKLPDSELTKVDITVPQTVVLGDDGVYRYGSANGPIMYVDMTGVPYADLYECYYPSVAEGARMRGTYVDENGKTCGYEFLGAMHSYADALDEEGFYYLTVDLANFINIFGKDQGWLNPEYSPFDAIKAGTFAEESAWLVSAYYDPSSAGQDPVIPEPNDPVGDDNKPESPATGDVSCMGAVMALLMSSVGVVSLRKKHN